MQQPPLWPRVIFVDWHGVLSRDPFWTSIRESATHPLRQQLEAGLSGVFAKESSTAHEWMKGLLSTDEIIAAMGIHLDRRFRDDFLARRLDVDCGRMKVNVGLLEVLRSMKAHASVVIATDNMDCFIRNFDHARARRRRPRPESSTLADWAIICDDIICSSEVGALKAEDPIAFFGPWLSAHNLGFADAVLIDDRDDNCAAFAAQGGTPVQYKMTTSNVEDVVSSLDRWFASAP
jgi:FMN phosphatase YigB (HAD superfamily)